jgi:6,7-dimethyl-8-ribityllumazine synthase
MTDKPHILIVASPYYAHITSELVLGATAHIQAAGGTCDTVEVPGVFELAAAIAMAMDGPVHYDGYVALGCVIRGETTHYDYVCSESARALQDLAVGHRLPIGYGVVTVENEAQAIERAFVDRRDKGGDAAAACLAMYALRRRFAPTAA